MKPPPPQAVVIGAGIAGLAASIRLQLQGFQVAVFEANDYPGGKLHSFELGAYRFDGGPSLFTMPHYIEELFTLAQRDPKQYFTYERCAEACRYFWDDGTTVIGHADPDQFVQEIETKLKVPRQRLDNYFAHIRNIYDHSGSIFLEQPIDQASTWLSARTVKALLRISQFDLFRTMHEANERRLQEPHLVQLFDRFATYNGSNPYKAPGILNVIPWLEHGFGTFFPRGGMASIPTALYQLAKDLGVRFRFGKPVSKILVEQGKSVGIEVDGSVVSADQVVCNMDVHFAYDRLLSEQPAPKRILAQEPSSSALVFYWGIKGSFEQLGLHNIFFGSDYSGEFDALFKKGTIIEDPTIYINISSKHNAEDAPKGCENWFVMINAPYEQGQDWATITQRVRASILRRMSALLNVNLTERIEVEKVWTPKGIEADTLSHRGALYGNSSNSSIAAFLRHPNQSSTIENLYFCGGSVHPGGGIPLALLSARITSEIIQKHVAV